ncbi:MAG: hypothetical protein ACYDD1_17815 [Caulobacteraceae bacterium]
MAPYRTHLSAPIRLGALALTLAGVALTAGCADMQMPNLHIPDVHLPVVPGAASDSNAPPAPSPGQDPYATPHTKGPLSINSSISQIAASPGGRDVLNRDMPGLLGRPEYPMFKMMSLKKIASMSNGQITKQALDKTAADLAAIGHQDTAPESNPNPDPQ